MNVNGGNLTKTNTTNQAPAIATVKSLLGSPNLKKRFEDMLGKKAAGFVGSLINLSSSVNLTGVEPMSIISSAAVAATLDLPIDPNLGFAYIVPYNDKKKGKVAQFQMGYKGFIQLAMRSGQYKTINATEVYEGEISNYNRFTGEMEFAGEAKSDKVVGYLGYFKLLNGFEKYLYMTTEQLQKHGKRFSKSYDKDYGLWKQDFNSMATKTVLKLLISKFGILSIDMQRALETDQAVVKDINGQEVEYVDNASNDDKTVDVDYKEVTDTGNNASGEDGPPWEQTNS